MSSFILLEGGTGVTAQANLLTDFEAIHNAAEISTSSSSTSQRCPQGRSDSTSLLSVSLSRCMLLYLNILSSMT